MRPAFRCVTTSHAASARSPVTWREAAMTATVPLVDDDAATLLLCAGACWKGKGTPYCRPRPYRSAQAPCGTSGHYRSHRLERGTESARLSIVVRTIPIRGSTVCRTGESSACLQTRESHLAHVPTGKDDLLKRGLLRPDLPFLQKPFTAEAFVVQVQRVLAPLPVSQQPKKDEPTKGVDWFG